MTFGEGLASLQSAEIQAPSEPYLLHTKTTMNVFDLNPLGARNMSSQQRLLAHGASERGKSAGTSASSIQRRVWPFSVVVSQATGPGLNADAVAPSANQQHFEVKRESHACGFVS